jgi:hypothetical protein
MFEEEKVEKERIIVELGEIKEKFIKEGKR